MRAQFRFGWKVRLLLVGLFVARLLAPDTSSKQAQPAPLRTTNVAPAMVPELL